MHVLVPMHVPCDRASIQYLHYLYLTPHPTLLNHTHEVSIYLNRCATEVVVYEYLTNIDATFCI